MISIIIPTYNEERYLPKLLKSIRAQKFNDYEIIVADNNSQDKTASIAEKYNCHVVKGGRPAKARNNGAKIAKGEYLLFLDADVILPKNFLYKAIKEFQEKKIHFACTLMKPISNKEIDKMYFEIQNTLYKYTYEIFPYSFGPCILVTKICHQKLKGFNEKINIGEDNEYGKRAKKNFKCGAITSTFIKISIRRFEKEGRAELIKKYLQHAVYEQLANLGIKKDVVYEFGDFKKKKNLSEIEKFLEKILQLIKKGSIKKVGK